ncbi:MAG TPA: hypothetical protein VMZ73_08770 [Acidimicrobiales bacterium]|nr:hypothetical protein [Acidimicrobiales bacterium]
MANEDERSFEILKESGILNTDVTLGQIMEAGKKLSAIKTGSEASVPTLIGNWYVYHTIEEIGGRKTNPGRPG